MAVGGIGRLAVLGQVPAATETVIRQPPQPGLDAGAFLQILQACDTPLHFFQHNAWPLPSPPALAHTLYPGPAFGYS
jgi:hypothetical protein